jgi:hypothetical protein
MEKEKEQENIPTCPACGSICIREKKVLTKTGIKNHEVEIWVCSEQKNKSCLS